jgi:GGDEF domain-containing protein
MRRMTQHSHLELLSTRGHIAAPDPLTGFGSRDKLTADLIEAIAPGRPPSTLAVFDLAGCEDFRRVFGEEASDELLVRLASEFGRVVKPHGTCYRSRRDEFCALVQLPPEIAATTLEAAASALREEGEQSLITTSFGVARLPDEADDPLEALMAADRHLLITRGARERRLRPRGQAWPPAA